MQIGVGLYGVHEYSDKKNYWLTSYGTLKKLRKFCILIAGFPGESKEYADPMFRVRGGFCYVVYIPSPKFVFIFAMAQWLG